MIEQITNLYHNKREELIKLYTSRAGKNDVEDVVQEAFYRALFYKDTYNPAMVDLEYWFLGIINNCLRDLLREKQQGSSMHDPLDDELLEYTEEKQGFKEIVLKELEEKKQPTRSVLYLHFVLDYQAKEIQRTLDMGYKNVETILGRFRSYLREKYPEYDSI